MRPLRPAILLFVAPLVTDAAASAGGPMGPWQELQQLLASDRSAGDTMGYSVSLDGDVAIAGAWGDDVDGKDNQGSAYIFRRAEGVWGEEQKLVASDGAAFDRFGRAVAVDGDTAVVGAYVANVGGEPNQGAVYVFDRVGGVWTETQKLTASDGLRFDRLGDPVALEGDTLMAAAPSADIGGEPGQGAVYVFTRSGGVWSEWQKLTVADGGSSDLLGLEGLVIRGDTALIGAHSATVNGVVNQGAAYFFQRTGGVWAEGQRLTASDGVLGDAFGSGLDFDSNSAIVGANAAEINGIFAHGAAYAFSKVGDTWVEQQKLTAHDGNEFSQFGLEVAVQNGWLLVAGETDEPKHNGVGAVYYYRLVDGVWTFEQKLVASDPQGLTMFGGSCSLDGDALLVGAGATLGGGAAYIFKHPPLFQDGFESGDTSAWSTTVP